MVNGAYVFLVLAVAVQRGLEVRLSRMNESDLKARGGTEHAAEQLPFMFALHALWAISALLEVVLLQRPFHRWLALLALAVFCAGQALRFAAMRALGKRWTIKVITVSGEPPVSTGVFRYLRHPNYLGVILEVAALPMIHTAYLTAIVFSVANAILLRRRVHAEERALAASSDYDERFRDRPRFWPKFAYVPSLPDDSDREPS